MDVQPQHDGPQFAGSPRFASLHSPRLVGQSYLSPTQDIRQLDPQHRMELELHSAMDPARASLNHAISPRSGSDVWHNSHISSPALASHLPYAPSSHVSSASTPQQPPIHAAQRSPSPLAPLLPAGAGAPTPLDSQPITSARERSVPINHSVASVAADAITSPPSTSLLPPQHSQRQQPQQPRPQHFPLSFPNAGAANHLSQQQLALYQQQLQLNQQQQQQLAHEHQLKLEQAHMALLAASSDGSQKRKATAAVMSPPISAPTFVPAATALSPNVALYPHPPPPPFMSMDVDPLVLQRHLHEQMLFQEKLLKQQQNLLALKRQQEQLLMLSPIGASFPPTQPFPSAAAAGADPRSPQTWQQQQPQQYQQHAQQPLPAAALPANAIVIPPLVRRSSSLFDHSPSPVAAVIPAVAVGGSSKYTPSPPPPPPIGTLLASSNSPRASPGSNAGGMAHIGNLQGLASTPKETKVAEIICGTAPATDVTSPPVPMMDVSSAPNSGNAAGAESPASSPRGDDLQTASGRRDRIAHMTKGAPVRFSRVGRAIVKTDLSSPEPPSSTHTQARSVVKREPRPAAKRVRKKKQLDTESDDDEEREERKITTASDNSEEEDANSDDSNESDSEGEQDDEEDDEISEADEKPRRKAKSARKTSPAARTPARKSASGKKKKDSASSPRPSTPPVKLNANGKPKREKGSSCHQCKTRRIDAVDLHYCGMTHPRRPAPPGARQRKRKKERTCRKKYCSRCILKFYNEQPPPKPAPGEPNTWSCPGCRGLCTCAACKRGFSKKEEQEAAQPAAAAAATSATPTKNGHQKPSSAASSAASTPALQRPRPALSVQAKALPVDKNRPLVASPVTPQSSAVAVVKKHAPVDRDAHAKRMHQAAMAVLGRKRAEPHDASAASTTTADSEGPTRRSPRNVARRMSTADRARENSEPERDHESPNTLSETSLPVDALDGLRSASPVASAHRSVLGLSSPLRSMRRGARRDSIAAPSHARSDTPDGEMLALSPAKQYISLRGILSPRHGLASSSHGFPDLGSHGFAAMGMSPAEAGGYRSIGGHERDEGGAASATTSTYTGAMSGDSSPMMHAASRDRRASRVSLMSGGGIGSNSGMIPSRRIDSNHFGDADGIMTDAPGIKRADLPELL